MFPEDLRRLYLASDGVFDAPAQWFVIWPIADVVIRNREAWSCEDSPSRRNLVGFGDDGTGAPFCVPRMGAADFLLVCDPFAVHHFGQREVRSRHGGAVDGCLQVEQVSVDRCTTTARYSVRRAGEVSSGRPAVLTSPPRRLARRSRCGQVAGHHRT
jgi:hypothetical protein